MTGVDGRNGRGGKKNCRHAYLSYYGMKDVDSVGAVLDWGIDRRLFESLVKSGSYYNFSYTSTCKDMNTSIDSTIQSPIVQCFCKTGFEGNPYLYGNCQEGITFVSYRRKIKAKMAGLEENCVDDLSHDSATNVIIDDFICSKKNQILCRIL
ncbi:hypothetical protein OIU85_012109 [Salix viminalis]|uniref:Uncharacterized protein n=1 Tax=Salix viminalis TaxID=40686 RepID=A0A9Q0NNK0_SALVM|nr:hypothetical protein OIU85_012109 [Salix viminalis]